MDGERRSEIDDLTAQLATARPPARLRAVRRLAEIGGREVVPPLLGVLRDERGILRGAAARELQKFSDDLSVA